MKLAAAFDSLIGSSININSEIGRNISQKVRSISNVLGSSIIIVNCLQHQQWIGSSTNSANGSSIKREFASSGNGKIGSSINSEFCQKHQKWNLMQHQSFAAASKVKLAAPLIVLLETVHVSAKNKRQHHNWQLYQWWFCKSVSGEIAAASEVNLATLLTVLLSAK